MKRIFVPTESGTDWQRLLAQPLRHWKKGASAMTTAASWEGADGALPPEIATVLNRSQAAPLAQLQLLAAMPEWKVALRGGDTASATDVLAICRNEDGLCILGVEAKVLEDFGPLLAEKREAASEKQAIRLAYLHSLLQVQHFSDGVRYQLLHRTASALLTARDFHATTAVMLVHAFDSPSDRRGDFERFATELGAQRIDPNVFWVPGFDKPALYLVWCDGDPAFRQVQLPGAL